MEINQKQLKYFLSLPIRIDDNSCVFANYIVYTDGRVFSLYTKRFLVCCKGKGGYWGYLLRIEKKSYGIGLHRLLAICFIPHPQGKDYINHKDGNKNNNKLENLEWCTILENNIHSIYELGNGSYGHRNIKACTLDGVWYKSVFIALKSTYGYANGQLTKRLIDNGRLVILDETTEH